MIFSPDLCALVLSGAKTVTRRPVSPNPRSPWGGEGPIIGRSYAIQPGRGKAAVGRLIVRDCHAERLGNITNEDAMLEGFSEPLARFKFTCCWSGLYGSYDPGQLVWRVAFELEITPR